MKEVFFTAAIMGIIAFAFGAVLYLFLRGLYTVIADWRLQRELKSMSQEAAERRKHSKGRAPISQSLSDLTATEQTIASDAAEPLNEALIFDLPDGLTFNAPATGSSTDSSADAHADLADESAVSSETQEADRQGEADTGRIVEAGPDSVFTEPGPAESAEPDTMNDASVAEHGGSERTEVNVTDEPESIGDTDTFEIEEESRLDQPDGNIEDEGIVRDDVRLDNDQDEFRDPERDARDQELGQEDHEEDDGTEIEVEEDESDADSEELLDDSALDEDSGAATEIETEDAEADESEAHAYAEEIEVEEDESDAAADELLDDSAPDEDSGAATEIETEDDEADESESHTYAEEIDVEEEDDEASESDEESEGSDEPGDRSCETDATARAAEAGDEVAQDSMRTADGDVPPRTSQRKLDFDDKPFDSPNRPDDGIETDGPS